MGIIVSAFTGIGKEEIILEYGSKIKILDLDVQSMIEEVPPSGFADTISSQINDYDIVFIPINKDIREELESRGIDYDIYYPSKDRRQEFILKFVGGKMSFPDIAKFDNNCNKYIDEIDGDESPNCYKHKLSSPGQFAWNDRIINNYINTVINDTKGNKTGVEEPSRSSEDNEANEEGNA